LIFVFFLLNGEAGEDKEKDLWNEASAGEFGYLVKANLLVYYLR